MSGDATARKTTNSEIDRRLSGNREHDVFAGREIEGSVGIELSAAQVAGKLMHHQRRREIGRVDRAARRTTPRLGFALRKEGRRVMFATMTGIDD